MVIQSHKAYKTRICSLKQNAQLEMHIRNVESKRCINNGNLYIVETGMAILGIRGLVENVLMLELL